MSSQRFTPEFEQEAIRQVLERGYSAEISALCSGDVFSGSKRQGLILQSQSCCR
jgi:hypothetical protein